MLPASGSWSAIALAGAPRRSTRCWRMRVSRWSRFGTADRRGAARRTPGVDRADRTHRSHPDLRERHLRSTTRTATNSDSHGGWRAVSIVHLSWRITVQRPAPAVPTHGRRAPGGVPKWVCSGPCGFEQNEESVGSCRTPACATASCGSIHCTTSAGRSTGHRCTADPSDRPAWVRGAGEGPP
jgi:hypothetical protein